jgi:hypothetical protein
MLGIIIIIFYTKFKAFKENVQNVEIGRKWNLKV